MTANPVVLNVEDFEPTRFLRSRVLRASGLDVVEAATAGEAIQSVSVAPPDLALIDIHLPDSDGYDLCRWLRGAHPTIPVLLISALHLTPSARMTALAAGAEEFLAEPVPPNALVERIKTSLAVLRRESRECWILTDTIGTIVDASPVAANMLHGSVRHLRGRHVLVYFDRDRAAWQKFVALASDGHLIRRSACVRPRERRCIGVDVEIAPEVNGQHKQLRWTFNQPDRD